MNGILVVDKPPDMTSARVVAKVKGLLKAKKVGHAGTLDPFATGVLICCINRATRLATFLLKGSKTYQGTLRLGVSTDTQDRTGRVISTRTWNHVTEEGIQSVVERFKGTIEQLPPVFSALKHEGTPLYRLARAGNPVQKPPRTVHIAEIRILNIRPPDVDFIVSCSAGTYIRTIASDIGEALNCGAHLHELRRTRCSGFTLEDSIQMPEFEERAGLNSAADCIISMEKAMEKIGDKITNVH